MSGVRFMWVMESIQDGSVCWDTVVPHDNSVIMEQGLPVLKPGYKWKKLLFQPSPMTVSDEVLARGFNSGNLKDLVVKSTQEEAHGINSGGIHEQMNYLMEVSCMDIDTILKELYVMNPKQEPPKPITNNE